MIVSRFSKQIDNQIQVKSLFPLYNLVHVLRKYKMPLNITLFSIVMRKDEKFELFF
jgi:hypothetical protein